MRKAPPVMAAAVVQGCGARMRCLLLPLALVACGGTSAGRPDGAGPDTPSSMPDTPNASTVPVLPSPTGPCPAIVNGDVTFAPAGIPPRTVKLALNPAAAS